MRSIKKRKKLHVQRNNNLPKAPYPFHPLIANHHFGIQSNTGHPVRNIENKKARLS
jgi:hypothetical protein